MPSQCWEMKKYFYIPITVDTMAYQITSLTIVYSTDYLGADQRKHQSSASLAMDTMAYQITSLTIVYSTDYLGADQRKHQSSASLAFVVGIHR